MVLLLVTLPACSMAGGWDTPGGDPAVGDDTAQGDDSGGESAPQLPALVISELMVDPDAVSDDVGEWFEVTNTGTATVDLDGAEFAGPGSDGFLIVGSLPVAAGGRLVFAVAADGAVNGGVTADYIYPTKQLKLSNEGGTLTLSVGEDVVDAVAWDALVKGHSVSLDPGAFDATANDAAESWCAAATAYGAGDYGTPGGANDACTGATDARPPEPGDLVVTEIMDDPDPTDDDTGEWFEILNVSGVPITLAGLEVRDASGESFTVEVDAVLADQGLLLFGASDDTDQNGGITPDLLFDDSLFHLGNDEDEVMLALDGVLIDEVAYDADFPHEKGKSRSVDPIGMSATRNDDARYWCEGDGVYGADGNQGTPGETNDDCP